MPVVVIHGHQRGPTIWLSAAIHGDELNGVAIVRKLIGALDPTRLAGTVLAVPVVNVFATNTGSRYLPDRRDLNRSFPGSPRGSLAARLAHVFHTRVVSRCRLGIDFHTGSNGRANLPQIRCVLDDTRTRQYASAFAPPLILDSPARGGSLRAAAAKDKIRVLLFEGGEAGRLDPGVIEAGATGTLRLIHHLKMMPGRAPARVRSEVHVARRSHWLRASRTGLCFLAVELGQMVFAGDLIATIADATGRREKAIVSRVDGIVIGVLRTALVHRGDALVHLAELSP